MYIIVLKKLIVLLQKYTVKIKAHKSQPNCQARWALMEGGCSQLLTP